LVFYRLLNTALRFYEDSISFLVSQKVTPTNAHIFRLFLATHDFWNRIGM